MPRREGCDRGSRSRAAHRRGPRRTAGEGASTWSKPTLDCSEPAQSCSRVPQTGFRARSSRGVGASGNTQCFWRRGSTKVSRPTCRSQTRGILGAHWELGVRGWHGGQLGRPPNLLDWAEQSVGRPQPMLRRRDAGRRQFERLQAHNAVGVRAAVIDQLTRIRDSPEEVAAKLVQPTTQSVGRRTRRGGPVSRDREARRLCPCLSFSVALL